MTHRGAALVVLGGVAASAATAVACAPYAEPLYFYMDGAREFLETGRITEYHSPGYSLLLAAAFGTAGRAGIFALNGLTLALSSLVALHLLRRAGLSPMTCLVGGLIVACNPILAANVTKVSDTNLATLLLLALIAALVHVRDRGAGTGTVATIALLFAAILLTRPNMALLFPVVLWAGIGHDARPRRWTLRWILGTAVALFVATATMAWATGRWRPIDPYYFAYTLHNGTNPRAADLILRNTIGEYSTHEALSDAGIDVGRLSKEELSETFLRLSVEFVRDQPLEYAGLLAVKLMNFSRPYFRPGRTGPFAKAIEAAEVLFALPIVVWAVLRLRAKDRWRRDSGLAGVVVLPLYVLPFVLINSEPRYRWPMDVVLMLESVMLVAAATSSRAPTRAWHARSQPTSCL